MKKICLLMMGLLVFAILLMGCPEPSGSGGGEPPAFEITVIEADSQLTVLWSSIEGCDLYEVWLDGALREETPINMNVITGLQNGQTYHVLVRAMVNGTFISSDVKSGTPPIIPLPAETPIDLRILSDDQMLIASWSPVAGATSYEVLLDNTVVDEVSLPEALITGLENGVSYSVQIQAKNNVGTSPKSGSVSRAPDRYIRKLLIGMGFNLFGSLSSSSVSLRPILHLDKLNQDDVYVIVDETESNWSVRSGSTIKDVNIGQNQSIGMGASMPFKGVLFSAGASAGYSRNSKEYTENHYALIRAEHFIKTVSLNPILTDPYEMRQYFTDGFLYALDHESPREILAHYGHVLMVKYRLGANQEIYVTHFNYHNETLQQFRASLNASVNILGINLGASVKGETSSSTTASEWRNNSEIQFSRYGGELSTALTLEDVFAEYPSWVSSIDDNPGFAGVTGYLNSFIPLWDIAKALGKNTLAQLLKDEFVRQAMSRVDELESIWPGEWFSYDEKVFDPGSTVFNHPTQFITDEEGIKYPATINYVFYVAAGGAGGRGYSSWGNSGSLNGGAGAGGALMKISLKSDNGIIVPITVGAGGSGGTEMSGHAWDGPGVSPGGDSSVVLYGQTFTTTGGQPSPYSDYRYYPAPGGVGTPLAAPDFVEEYIIANGGQTNGVWNQPGAGGKIDVFSAGSGGIGGTYSNGGHGQVGGNGWVRVRWFFYDGQ